MKKMEIVKTAGLLVISIGVGAIVGNAISMTTPADTKIIKKICVVVGGFVLSSMISDAASKYAEEKIDSAVDSIKSMVNEEDQVKGGEA